MAGALLEFLQVIAEEFANNLRLDVVSDFAKRGRNGDDGEKETKQVVGLLSMYLQAPGEFPFFFKEVLGRRHRKKVGREC